MSLKTIHFVLLTHHLSRHKVTGKMCCQSGDCIWSPISLRGLFGYVWVNILYYLWMFKTWEVREQSSGESDDCHNSFWASYSCHELWSTIKRDIIVVETQSWVAYIFHNFAYFIISFCTLQSRLFGIVVLVVLPLLLLKWSVKTTMWLQPRDRWHCRSRVWKRMPLSVPGYSSTQFWIFETTPV